jgi:L-amino acid N-acyltransferase YncA
VRVQIQPLTPQHWDAVRRIYEAGIASGNATFETHAPSWEAWDAKQHATCRVVAIADGAVIGWAAASPISRRAAYAGVAEVSVYVDPDAQGRGAGRALLGALITAAEAAGIWTLQAGIFPENEASLALHRAAGFREVGRRERIGRHHGRWRDVVLLERRSGVVGV